MKAHPSRRLLLQTALSAAGLTMLPRPRVLAAQDPIDLDWGDLIPEGDGGLEMSVLRSMGIVEHGQMQSTFDQPDAAAVVTEYNGKRVRIPGYAVPLDFDGTQVSTFILVPYIGACIHVPPPPPNQLVFVTPDAPFEQSGLWDPIHATGVLTTEAIDVGLADVGYSMTEAEVRPYSED